MSVKRGLALILFLYALLGVAYAVVVPLGEAPDEVDHFLYVEYLLRNRAFPLLQPIPEENVTMEANQPPLFYLLNAALVAPIPLTETADFPLNQCYSFTPNEGRAHFYLHSAAEAFPYRDVYLAFQMARLFSVLLGGVTVYLAFVLGRQMAPKRPFVGLLAAALLAFNPQFIFMMASVNNDVLMALLGAAIVVSSGQAATKPGGKQFAILGVLVGLALLTKFALLALWPLAVIAVFVGLLFKNRSGQQQATRRYLFVNLLLVLGLPLLIAGWWYVRAWQLYGDPLAWAVHLQAKGSEVLRTSPFTWADLGEFGRVHFQSYWGWFGWLKLRLPSWVYLLLLGLVGTAVFGIILELKDWRIQVRPFKRFLRTIPANHVAVIFNLLAVAAIYVSLLRYIQTINWSGYQGRLAYAGAASVAGLLALGLGRLCKMGGDVTAGGKRNNVVGVAIGLAMFVLSVAALFLLVRPAYARPLLYWPPAEAARVCVSAEVEAATWPEVVRPGEVVEVSLFGVAEEEPSMLLVDLVGRDGTALAAVETAVSEPVNQPITTTVSLLVPADARPARGVLRVNGVDLGVVKIAPTVETAVPDTAMSLDVNFGGVLQLTAVESKNNDGMLTFYWQLLADTAVDYTTFVHLLDAEGNVIAQADSQPANGQYPTSIWDVGELVADQKWMPENSDADPSWTISVGVYLLESGERLPIMRNGNPSSEETVQIKLP